MAGTVRTTSPMEGLSLATWADLVGGENGNAAQMAQFPDKSIVVTGTGTVAVQGSNDGVNWVPLHDAQGVAISALGAGASVIAENTFHIRVVSTGAAGLNVTILGVAN